MFRYIIRFLLFKIGTPPEKETALLALPEICTDKIITLLSFKSICRTSRSHKDLSDN